ncbi:unnamed protein product [Ostreobium quekettii]|uniref:Fibronectin type-II domain-containing protein n=1 Tax=Ostreobium quekettii TaxID=121088 RepID=A0A8S1INF5_9CHLO|nr:unnamed protein product [Ostreobium quekettii]|eukprot:evm.model.scf_74.13 EVM.evm.TU.scf_74.13   scf_74:82902-92821(+)
MGGRREFATLFAAVAVLSLALGVRAQRSLVSGEPCVFPFQFEGRTYFDCLDFQGSEWCEAEGGFFGQCAPGSPASSSGSASSVGSRGPGIPAPVTSAPEEPVQPPPSAPVLPASAPVPPLASSGSDCCNLLSGIGFSSSVPVVIINTGGQAIPDEPKIPASICTCNSPGGDIAANIKIEIRGSTSAREFLKKSFAFKVIDDQGKDMDVSFMGFPEDSDFVLYGPEMDKTMGMKNYLTMALARATGRYASNTQYVETFLVQDGGQLSIDHYHGIYIAMEKIKKDKNRVNVQKNEADISGGYIFKYDNDNFDEGDKIIKTTFTELEFVCVYPKKDKVTQDQLNWIGSYLGDWEKAMGTRDRNQWTPYIDEGSFVDYFLITEMSKNPDGYRGSTYFHKDAGGPLVAGPAWDYNEAYGQCCGYPIEGYDNDGISTGVSGGSAISPEGWRFNICIEERRCIEDPRDGTSPYYMIMMEDPTFRSLVESRWSELRAGPWSTSSIEGLISQLKGQIQDPVLRNLKRWKTSKFLEGVSGNDQKNLDFWSFEVNAMLEWVRSHAAWIDSQLSGSPALGK